MALIRKSQVDEWVNIHGGKSAAELSMELRDNMTGYIGPGGAAKGRLMSGEQVVVLQLLYNKLVEMGKISGSEIKVDGTYGGETRSAIQNIRKLVGGDYPVDRENLKNKNIEKSLDAHTVDNLVKLLTFPTMRPTKEVPGDIEERLEVLNRDLDFLESRCEVYRETRAFQVSIDTSRVHDEIDALKKKFKNGDWNVVSAELAYMQIDVSDMHYTLSALNALATVEANTNIERYLAILGPEKVKTLTNALKKGYELESAGQHNMELLSAYRRNIRLLNCWLEAHLIS